MEIWKKMRVGVFLNTVYITPFREHSQGKYKILTILADRSGQIRPFWCIFGTNAVAGDTQPLVWLAVQP